MKFSSMLTAQSLAFASALVLLGPDTIHAQLIGSQPRAGQSGSLSGQPPVGQSGGTLTQPGHPSTGATPGTGLTPGSDPVRDKLNRANREAADLDRDGRISPEEASRMPPGTSLP